MNLENYLDSEKLSKNIHNYKSIFFYRICGTGMGAAACLMKEAGFNVSGADSSFAPPMSTYLESTGIELSNLEDVDARRLREYDLVVVGNSVPKGSRDAQIVEECGVPFCSFPTAIGTLILRDKAVIGVAGTHGKTTTTFFLTKMLEALGERPGYFIGGIMDDRPPARKGSDQGRNYFVIESDEYDSAYFEKFSKFHRYEIDHLLLTSLEFDHADIYENLEQIKDEFQRLRKVELTSEIMCFDYSAVRELVDDIPSKNLLVYGRDQSNPKDIRFEGGKSLFTISFKGEEHKFSTNILGAHNIENLTACILFLLSEGFEVNRVNDALSSLSMVKRRQEERGRYKSLIVIDDFAHHPRAIKETLKTLALKYPQKKIFTIFEPISSTARSNVFQKDYIDSFEGSEKIIFANSQIDTTARSYENLDLAILSKEIEKKHGIPVVEVQELSDLMDEIDSISGNDAVLAVLSNRTCLGLWNSNFVE